MPQLFRVGSYIVYFWANESEPLEPLHVHIAEGRSKPDATKIWITQSGHCILSNNRSLIPGTFLRKIMQLIEANSEDIKASWISMFGQITYFC